MTSAASAQSWDAPSTSRAGRLVRAGGILLRFVIGTLLCLSPLTSIVAAGWLYRYMARATAKRWYVLSGGAKRGPGFDGFMRAEPATRHLATWPNWMVNDGGWSAAGEGHGRIAASVSALFGAAWANFRTGVAVLLNTWVLTLPAGALWLLAWWGGWENSFNKGYEQHWVGPTVFILGSIFFALAMWYLPFAQARQAITGNWRSFYDYRMIRILVRERWLSCLGLAILFALASIAVMGLKVLPLRLDGIIGDYSTMSEADLRDLGGRYFTAATAILFAILIFLRGLTGRFYAGAVIDAVRDGLIERDHLSRFERSLLQRLDLLSVQQRPPRHRAVRLAAWLGSRTARMIGFVLGTLIWGAFVFELVAAQFLNHVWIGWLSHPLIHLPWIWQGPM